MEIVCCNDLFGLNVLIKTFFAYVPLETCKKLVEIKALDEKGIFGPTILHLLVGHLKNVVGNDNRFIIICFRR